MVSTSFKQIKLAFLFFDSHRKHSNNPAASSSQEASSSQPFTEMQPKQNKGKERDIDKTARVLLL